ncbi:glycosyltransferase [Subdoligranulum sp. AM23-21AC]|nr:glycosyltransferase [Subdoligranulum sp. AM23-21AC]RJW29000.1 glycosyltransferase [Subdoligranulum sp. TF05-17AC]
MTAPRIRHPRCVMCGQIKKRIRAVHKKNGETASARNFGVEVSQGEYIAFLDNDDWYELQMLERLYGAVTQNDVLLAACNYYVWRQNEGVVRWPLSTNSKKYSYENVIKILFLCQGVFLYQ